ncbi:hypothetical protein [Winogradskyella thalassocola]|uniref:Phosphodiester glycosidase domain-containing protein n=1 Tax=Winogradskyella thalassocola TaxID=262004 RepID=A0A1G7VN62_9FLAO|nr:hypothetical protein [Winogradskyella thalassocola]SDG61137.1 hypothetical protein SAMN04489796_10172 [Winogradskyella thalassocola]
MRTINLSEAQSESHNALEKISLSDNDFQSYEFGNTHLDSKKVKIKYLVKDAYNKFLDLEKNKDVLLVTSASFTSAFFSNGTPIGLCAYEGEFLNKMPDQTMDGLVVINSDGLINTNDITDLDFTSKNCDSIIASNHSHLNLNPRENALDSYVFYNRVEENNLSVFQTQLVYSHLKTEDENFKTLLVGSNSKERRFLVIATKEGELKNLIIDTKNKDYILKAAQDIFNLLKAENYDVNFILNLDTGSKNILHVNNGTYLENLNPNPSTKLARIERASSLIVFYTDK